MLWSEVQTIIDWLIEHWGFNHSQINDGHHTIGELYEFRGQYNAGLFNAWHQLHPEWGAHKSKCHHDGKPCFGDGKWFVASAKVPGVGLITNHYKMESWDYFQIPEEEKERWEFDGTTPADVLKRLKLINGRP